MFFVLLGLAIGIATMVSVYGVVETMKAEMTRQVTKFGVNVVITPDSGGLTFSYGGIALPEIMYDVEQLTTEDVTAVHELLSRDMIRVVAPKLIGMHQYGKDKVVVVGANLQQEFLVKPWLRIQGDKAMSQVEEPKSESIEIEDGKKMDFETLDLTRQDLDQLNLSDKQILIGSALANSLNIQKGDFLTLSGRELEVYGILAQSGSVEDQQIFMNITVAQDILDRPNEITVIEMAVDYTVGSEETLLSELNQALPHTNVTSLRQETLRRDEMLVRLVRFGMAISILVLLVGMLVVGLTMSNSVRERTREIGVFRALGFRKSHIAKIILMEGVLISIVGGIIGFISGMIIARYAGPIFAGMDIMVPWRVDLLLISIGLAVLIGLISSVYPAYKATEQDPVEALRFI